MNTLASLLNLGGPDLIVVLVIVLLLFGAKKLPELAKGLGQAVKEFSKAKDEFEHELTRPPVIEPPKAIDAPKVETAHDPHAQSMDHPAQPQPVEHTQPQTAEHHI